MTGWLRYGRSGAWRSPYTPARHRGRFCVNREGGGVYLRVLSWWLHVGGGTTGGKR